MHASGASELMFVAGAVPAILLQLGSHPDCHLREWKKTSLIAMKNNNSLHKKAPLVLALVVCLMSASFDSAHAQLPKAIQFAQQKTPPSQEKEQRTTGQWQEDVERRLAEAEERAKKLEADQEQSVPETLTRQIELLKRVDTLLAQLSAEEEVTLKNEDRIQKLKTEVEEFLQIGLGNVDRIPFTVLDNTRDELNSEKVRLERLEDKLSSFEQAQEAAEEEYKQRSSTRRKIREKFLENQKDDLRQKLGKQLAEAVLQNEIAEATAALSKQEAKNANQSVKLQQYRVKLIEERIARMQSIAAFGDTEINELMVSLERAEDDLKSDLVELESNETKLKYLQDQWVRAKRKFDESTGNKETLREEIAAHEIGRRVIQERIPLLQKQIERLAANREIWQQRQKVFNQSTKRKELHDWEVKAEKAVAQLKREQRTAEFEVEELKNLIKPLKDKQQNVAAKSVEAYWIEQQISNLGILVAAYQQSQSSIRESIELHNKLLDEAGSDSIASTARDRISDLWGYVEWFWNYELYVVDDESAVTVKKIVTALAIIFAGMFFSRKLSRALRRQVLRRLDFDPSASATIQSLFYYTLLLIFGLFALKVAKVPLTAFTVLGGAVALGIGFGSQNIINNFISGLVMMAERPVKVGDLIQIGELYGNIEHIGARSTCVRTGSNLEIIVPNSTFLQDNVINFTLSSNKVRTNVTVGVVYGSPTVTVTQLLRRAAVETGRVAKDPPPIILFKDFADSALLFEVHFWIHMRTMMDQYQIESAVRFRIDQLFREEGITIAFPQRDVHLDTTSPLAIQMVQPPSETTG